MLDQAGSILVDPAHALSAVADSAGEPSELLRDAADIQRMIAERHGAQRQRLGWSEDAVRREYRILQEIVLRTLAGEEAGDGPGRDMIRRLLVHAEIESVHAPRAAAAAMSLATRPHG